MNYLSVICGDNLYDYSTANATIYRGTEDVIQQKRGKFLFYFERGQYSFLFMEEFELDHQTGKKVVLNTDHLIRPLRQRIEINEKAKSVPVSKKKKSPGTIEWFLPEVGEAVQAQQEFPA